MLVPHCSVLRQPASLPPASRAHPLPAVSLTHPTPPPASLNPRPTEEQSDGEEVFFTTTTATLKKLFHAPHNRDVEVTSAMRRLSRSAEVQVAGLSVLASVIDVYSTPPVPPAHPATAPP